MKTEENCCCEHKNCKWESAGYGYGAVEMEWKCQDCGKVLKTNILVD